LVDEDSQARTQLNILRAEGHDVLAIGEIGKNGTPDPEVFELAQTLDRVLLTHNAEDFNQLHLEHPGHPEVMAVYRDANPLKNMTYADIARAIVRLERSGMPVGSEFHVLNHWR